jgi:beta-glucosidase
MGAREALADSGNPRVDRLISQMSLEEKISLIHGVSEQAATDQGQAGYWPGLPRLGIPSLRLTDGPPGVLTRHPSTGMTATMGLAATFSRSDARANGVVIGRDARALGQDIVLEPFINIFRDQTFARAYNTFGEDPFLSGQLAAAQIGGIQEQGVMAQAKHYVGYDGGNDVIVSAQALREIYVAPFADAVNAGVSSIMCSYNKINGEYSCGNEESLIRILKTELGFRGFVTSDWGAVHDTLYVNRGLDLEMPGTLRGAALPYFHATVPTRPAATPQAPGAGPLAAAVPEEAAVSRQGGGGSRVAGAAPLGMLDALRDNKVSASTLDAAVARILSQLDRFGYLTRAPRHDVTPQATAFNAQTVRTTAEHAAVLLKNDGVLPLQPADFDSIVFIGPGAAQTIAIGASGEKALGHVERQLGTVQALQSLLHLPTGKPSFAVANDMTGAVIPVSQLSHDGQPGLLHTIGGETRADAELNFTRSNSKSLPAGSRHSWKGTLTVPTAGMYHINLQLLGASGSVRIDGNGIGGTASLAMHGNVLQPGQDNLIPTPDGLDNVRRAVVLTAGAHSIEIDANGDESGDPVQVRLAWATPGQRERDRADAINAARNARAAVVFAWGRGNPVFALPGEQDQLIADIAAVNANTIVVLNTSQPIAMPWLSNVKGVLQMWYPGDEGGWATANILLGRANPAGRLPFTWPTALAQNVANDPAHPERSSAGVEGTTQYSEGIMVGYRWFDAQKIEPRFAFGFGLSYTKFDYSNLRVAAAKDGGIDVSFTLRNSGSSPGDEVPQVYLGAPGVAPSGAQFALRSLVAFDRVTLRAGQSRQVSLHVPLRQLQYWDTASNAWKTAGQRPIYVGTSSRELRLTGATTG